MPALLPGLVPEELLAQLISKRVDYYFARVSPNTDAMMEVFKGVYEESQSGVAFEILVGGKRGAEWALAGQVQRAKAGDRAGRRVACCMHPLLLPAAGFCS